MRKSDGYSYTLRFYEKKISENEIQYVPVDKLSKKISSKFPRCSREIYLTPKNLHILESTGIKMEIK